MAQYGNMTLREREDKIKLRKRNEEKNVDSDSSTKDSMNKRSRRTQIKNSSRYKYDADGIDKETGLDLCDCLIEECPGCWMDCPKCGSRKCGHDCRQFRRYKYDYIEIEGTSTIIKHKK